MNMKTSQILILTLAAGALTLSGCGKKAPREASPAERNRLVIRMFQSLDRDDAAAAVSQAEKFRALDPANLHLTTIIDVQRGNVCIQTAQQLLAEGKSAAAVNVLEAGVKNSPLNRHLASELQKVRRLVELEHAVVQLRKADDLNSRSRAVIQLERLATRWKSPELAAAIKAQRTRLDADIAAELARQKAEAEARAQGKKETR